MKQSPALPTPAAAGTANLRAAFGLLLAGAIGSATPPAPGQSVTQTFMLQPGWNAIYLEVQPADNSAGALFSHLPVASVWTRAERLSPVDFIANPSEAAFNNPAWLRWFPPARPESFLGNLFAVFANRAYLLQVTNATPLPWSVSGRPSLRAPEWVPDSYNLRGLPVDPVSPPPFLNFFRPSQAHFNPAIGQLENIYRLNSGTGQWELVAPTDPVQNGVAYWIYTRGASDYLAPLSAKVDAGDGLDFALDQSELNLRLANLTAGPLSGTMQEMNAGGLGHLASYRFDPAAGGQWPDLPSPFPFSLAAGAETRLRLAIRRQDLAGTSYSAVLAVRDGVGTRLLVPVNARAAAVPAAAPLGGGRQALSGSAGAAAPAEEARSHAGLWIGTAALQAVSEAHSANPSNPTPAKSPFNLRLIIHVDANGQARLLKEVTQMWRNGTFTNDGSGQQVADKPGQYVLLTEDTLLPFFSGSAVRDGAAVGQRVSTIGYDFPSAPGANFAEFTGAFAAGQTIAVTLTLPFDHPTNPFKHRYHPDHDNLNARFDGPAIESYTTTREIELDLLSAPPDGPARPDYGYSVMGGNYRETIRGLHKNPIHVSGAFRLSRVSRIAELNPSPTP